MKKTYLSNFVLEDLNNQVRTSFTRWQIFEHKIYSTWYESIQKSDKPKKDISLGDNDIIYQ